MADLGAVPEDELLEGEYDDLPEFANDENRALHRQVRAKETKLKAVEAELSETQERITVMKEHRAKSVTNEQLHTQRLVDAKVKEISTEDHLKQLAERESGRFHAEFKKLQGEIAELEDKVNLLQNGIFKGNEQMEQFKLQMNWNQDELEQWALAARQKEEDNLALLKYTKADEAKMKDLSLQLEKMLDAAVQKKRAELEEEVTKTQANADRARQDGGGLPRSCTRSAAGPRRPVGGRRCGDAEARRGDPARARGVRRGEEAAAREAGGAQRARRLPGDRAEEQRRGRAQDRRLRAHHRQEARDAHLCDGAALGDGRAGGDAARRSAKAATEMGKAQGERRRRRRTSTSVKARLDGAPEEARAAEQMLDASQKNVSDGERRPSRWRSCTSRRRSATAPPTRSCRCSRSGCSTRAQKLFALRQTEADPDSPRSRAPARVDAMAQQVKRLDEEAQRQRSSCTRPTSSCS